MTLDEFTAKFEARLVLLGLYGIRNELEGRVPGPFNGGSRALAMPETAKALLKEMWQAMQPDEHPRTLQAKPGPLNRR